MSDLSGTGLEEDVEIIKEKAEENGNESEDFYPKCRGGIGTKCSKIKTGEKDNKYKLLISKMQELRQEVTNVSEPMANDLHEFCSAVISMTENY